MCWSRVIAYGSDRLSGYRLKTVRCSLVLLWVGCLFLFFDGRALGYVINGDKILSLMSRQIGRAHTLMVRQNLTTYVVEQHTRREMADEVIRYIFPDTFRVDLTAEGMNRSFLAREDRTLTVVNDKNDPKAESELDLYHYFLLRHRLDDLIKFLEAFGVDTTVSSLGKFEQKVAYVLGAQYPNIDNSQLWIDKERFLPMRWILVVLSEASQQELEDSQGQPAFDRLEFRFSLWQKFDNLHYPKRIDIFYNDVLQREIRVEEVMVNQELDSALMDINLQLKQYPPPESEALTTPLDSYEEENEDSTDDIQRTIDNFKKKFE